MSSSPPSLVTVPRFDSDQIVQELMNTIKAQDPDKGELQEFENDEDRLDSMVHDLEVFKRVQSIRDMLITCNRSLAEFNLSMEPRLQAGRDKLIDTYQNKETLEAQFAKNKQTIEELSGQYSTDTTMALLQTASAQAEDEAEKTVDTFLEGQMDIDTFIQTFQQQKTLHHLRRVKTEKLNELLQKRTPSQNYNRF